jgi:hypothetical protein
VPVSIEFLPSPDALAAIIQFIRKSHRAFPLFELAREFLARPDRHRVRIAASDPGVTLYAAGEGGPVALSREALVRAALESRREELYVTESVQLEEIKGNFTNVARHTITGTLLGPTNHHGYQPALRRLYEERFSRRMSFDDFKRSVETVSDPEVVARWKEQARTVTVYKTRDAENPKTFSDFAELEADFRLHHFDGLVKEAAEFTIGGDAAKLIPDRALAAAVRYAWDRQKFFPGHVMSHLRRAFFGAGMHVFRHGEQAQFVMPRHPAPYKGDLNALNEGPAGILRVLEETGGCTRADLATRLLPPEAAEPELGSLRTKLAADLHWLVAAGHVIEFLNGRIERAQRESKGPSKHPERRPERKPDRPQGGANAGRPKPAASAEAPTVEARSAEAPAVESPAVEAPTPAPLAPESAPASDEIDVSSELPHEAIAVAEPEVTPVAEAPVAAGETLLPEPDPEAPGEGRA